MGKWMDSLRQADKASSAPMLTRNGLLSVSSPLIVGSLCRRHPDAVYRPALFELLAVTLAVKKVGIDSEKDLENYFLERNERMPTLKRTT